MSEITDRIIPAIDWRKKTLDFHRKSNLFEIHIFKINKREIRFSLCMGSFKDLDKHS
jgi:hypothetical protein